MPSPKLIVYFVPQWCSPRLPLLTQKPQGSWPVSAIRWHGRSATHRSYHLTYSSSVMFLTPPYVNVCPPTPGV